MSTAGVHALLGRVPLPLRMAVYAAVFLTLALAVLPWAAARVDGRLAWLQLDLPPLVRGLGWSLFAVALLTYGGCSLWLTFHGRGAYVEFDPPREFVASGPYRWCRNPIAACVVLMLGGLALAYSSGGVLLLFLLAFPLAHLQVVVLEEPLLAKRFGERYREYQRAVPRWIPRRPRGDGS